jgi:hypothetical protein
LECPRQMLSHAGSADVIGNMPAEIFRRETKHAIGGWNRILGVVTEKERAALPVSIEAPERRSYLLLLPQPIKPLLHRLTSNSHESWGSYLGFTHPSKGKGCFGSRL